jgi:hypothetical protein
MDLALDAALAPKSAGRRHSHSFTVADIFEFLETFHIHFTPIQAHMFFCRHKVQLCARLSVLHILMSYM